MTNFAMILGRVHRRVVFAAQDRTVHAVEWVPCDKGDAAFDATVASRVAELARIAGTHIVCPKNAGVNP